MNAHEFETQSTSGQDSCESRGPSLLLGQCGPNRHENLEGVWVTLVDDSNVRRCSRGYAPVARDRVVLVLVLFFFISLSLASSPRVQHFNDPSSLFYPS